MATYLSARTVGFGDAAHLSCPGAGESPWDKPRCCIYCGVRNVPRVSRCPWNFLGLEGVGELGKSIGGFDAGLLVARHRLRVIIVSPTLYRR